MSYRREYTKIYETYLKSRNKRFIKEDMTVNHNATATEIPENPNPAIQTQPDPNVSPNDGLPLTPQQGGSEMNPNGINPVVAPMGEKEQYLGLVQSVMTFLMKADNLTQSEIDVVHATLNKVKFVS